MNPEKSSLVYENREVGDKIVNLSEGSESDLKIFFESLEARAGKVDILVHPFYEDYGESRYGHMEGVYTQIDIPEQRKRRDFAQNGINILAGQNGNQSKISEDEKRVVCILQEQSTMTALPYSLRGRGISTGKIFVIETEDSKSTPIIPVGFSKKIRTELKRNADELHPFFELGLLLHSSGVKDVRLSGGYITLEKNKQGELVHDRCLGLAYTNLRTYTDSFLTTVGQKPFNVDLSPFSWPETKESLAAKGF